MNSNRDPKKQPDPIRLPVPWPDSTTVEDVTPEERVRLRAELLRHSAFAE